MTAPLPEGRPPSGNRERLVAALVLVVVFVAGLLTGAWGSHFVRPGRFGDPRPRFGAHRDQPFVEGLDLTAAQHAKVDTILARRRAEMDAFWRGPGLQLRAIVDSTREDIRAVLTPDQRAKMDRRHEQFRRERARRGGGPENGPMGPPPGAPQGQP
jgi:Spy/CpxP family protein refolding chaperone